jgi:hypothetical protein
MNVLGKERLWLFATDGLLITDVASCHRWDRCRPLGPDLGVQHRSCSESKKVREEANGHDESNRISSLLYMSLFRLQLSVCMCHAVQEISQG